jgi:hypothetical protein
MRRKAMNKCSRCSKPIQNGATITINKPVYSSRFERFYTLCGYCTEEVEEFLRGNEEENNEKTNESEVSDE